MYRYRFGAFVLLVVLSAALVTSACEPPTAPDLTNPYDPRFEGIPIPTPPSNLTLASSEAERVSLSWLDNSSFEEGYIIERSSAIDTNFAEIGRVGADVTSFTDETVELTKRYRYRVRAFHESEQSLNSDTVYVRYSGVTEIPLTAGPSFDRIVHLRFSPDGQTLIAAGRSRYLLRVEPLGLIRELDEANLPHGVTFNDTGEYLAASDVGRVEVWRTDGLLARRLDYPNDSRMARQLAFAPGGELLAYTWGDTEIRKWNWQEESLAVLPNPAQPSELDALGFEPDGETLVGIADGNVLRFTSDGGTITSRTPLEQWSDMHFFERISFSPDLSYIVAAGLNGAYLWKTEDGTLHASYLPSVDYFGLEFSGDTFVLYGNSGAEIYLTSDGTLLSDYPFDEIGEELQAVTISPNRRYLAAVFAHRSGEDPSRRLMLWDLHSSWETAGQPNFKIDGPPT